MKLNGNYSLLTSNNELVLYSSEDNSFIIEGDSLEDVKKIINFIIEYKGNNHIADVKLNFKKLDSEYIDSIFTWLLENEILVETEFKDKKSNVTFFVESDLISGIELIATDFDKNIVTDLNDINCDTDLLVVCIPFYEMSIYVESLDYLANKKNIKILYSGFSNNLLTLGPIIDLEKDTCSFSCLVYKRIDNSFDKFKMKKLFSQKWKETHTSIKNKFYLNMMLNLLFVEITKFLRGEVTLYSYSISINLIDYNIEKSYVLKDYRSPLFSKNQNVSFND